MMTNVKKIGNEFEKEFEKLMRDNGFWVHFCAPNAAGAQPADFIAARGGKAYLIDCKTCEKNRFSIARLEINQLSSFHSFLSKTSFEAYIAVKHDDDVYMFLAREFVYEDRTYFAFTERDKFSEWVKRQ